MSNFHEKLEMPDPQRKIGETPDGKPIWMDMRELISSPEENEERVALTLESRQRAEIDKAARVILRNAAIFIEQTFHHVTPRNVCDASDPRSFFDYAQKTGFCAIQDGLKTVVKQAGKVIREMDAKVPPALAERVAARVNELVKAIPA